MYCISIQVLGVCKAGEIAIKVRKQDSVNVEIISLNPPSLVRHTLTGEELALTLTRNFSRYVWRARLTPPLPTQLPLWCHQCHHPLRITSRGRQLN